MNNMTNQLITTSFGIVRDALGKYYGQLISDNGEVYYFPMVASQVNTIAKDEDIEIEETFETIKKDSHFLIKGH